MLELTDRCNLDCHHCYVSSPEPETELSLAEWKHVMDQLAAAGCLFLNLSGGEPLMRQDFFEIAAYARARGFSLTLFTNATLINPGVADRLRRLCLQRAEISLLGPTPGTHDALTRVAGSFAALLQAVGLLTERGINVQLKTTWLRSNISEAPRVRALASRLGVSFRSGHLLLPRRGGTLKEHLDLLPTASQRRQLAREGHGEGRGEAARPNRSLTATRMAKVSPCGAGQTSCLVDAQGRLRPCVAIPTILGDLRKTDFDRIWLHSAELRRIRELRLADLPECTKCELVAACRRCAGLALAETGSWVSKSPQACAVAQAFAGAAEEGRCDIQ